MLNIEIRNKYKSVPAGEAFSLPNFSVITGKNGSGKSHLLEAISAYGFVQVEENNIARIAIQLVKFGEFSANITQHHDPKSVADHDLEIWNRITQLQREFEKISERNNTYKIEQFLMESQRGTPAAVYVIQQAIAEGKTIDQLKSRDVGRLSQGFMQGNTNRLFSSNLAGIFNTYNVRFYENDHQNYAFGKKHTSEPGLTDAIFESKFGPKPWDLINEILKRAGLIYQIVPPDYDNLKQPYSLKLTDPTKDIEISVDDLSTGEKALMSLGLAIYGTQEGYGKPDLLLLDEPDAPLHPEFSRLLVKILSEVIVEKAGVHVIMTTHSPSTLVCCPPTAIFEMDRETGRPIQITLEKGMEILTAGIPHLRISKEPRRQVFVESKYDVVFFEHLFNALHHQKPFTFEPVFLPPHSGTSNCTDVMNIVSLLKDAGNDLVRGIVDWDGKNTSQNPIFVLGEGRRYAIENYILDPLFVALALIKARKKTFSDFGIENRMSYLEVAELENHEAQKLASGILLLAGITQEAEEECMLLNGFPSMRPKEFLEMNGHTWEETLIDKIPELKALIRGATADDKLKKPVLDVIEDAPQFLPVEIRETFEGLN